MIVLVVEEEEDRGEEGVDLIVSDEDRTLNGLE